MGPRVLLLAAIVLITGCSTRTGVQNLYAIESRWDGPVFVSQEALPPEIEHRVLGTVKADMRAGYSSAASLYPALAAEAKKIGANAVISTSGGRRMTVHSWSAPYVSGTAVRVQDPEKLKGLSGEFH